MTAVNRRFGRLDALVNNAGIAVFAPLLETSDQDWNRVLAVNLTGPFLCTKAAAPLMREHGGGAIVNITSISAVRASTLRSAYGTSKAGLAHLTKQLAVELASLGIRVNGVAPGPVETAMAKAVHTPEIRADYHDAIPLNRYGLEEELAEAVFFLCSDRASYITGQILAVDGGFDAAGIGLPTLRGAATERTSDGTGERSRLDVTVVRSKNVDHADGFRQNDLARGTARRPRLAAGACRDSHPRQPRRTGRSVPRSVRTGARLRRTRRDRRTVPVGLHAGAERGARTTASA